MGQLPPPQLPSVSWVSALPLSCTPASHKFCSPEGLKESILDPKYQYVFLFVPRMHSLVTQTTRGLTVAMMEDWGCAKGSGMADPGWGGTVSLPTLAAPTLLTIFLDVLDIYPQLCKMWPFMSGFCHVLSV